ncbi:M20 family metallo-hydrolase [Halobacillus litoralis]|nr:M20 family metallo-hydrolase [Halobacillus litoralis]
MNQWLHEKLLELNVTDSMKQPDGFTRLSYTEEEKSAHQAFRSIAEELELDVQSDQAGNLWATWMISTDAPTIATGSHLDTVHNGGGYDGAAGVLCSLASIKIMKDEGITPQKNISVVCFASEESARFGVSTIGSKAVSGLLNQDELADVPDADGITIREATEHFGLTWETFNQAERRIDELESFLELHIEQGTQIEDQGAEVGVVRGVACPIRLKVTAYGMANHTGTTPMNKRIDAFAGISPLIPFVEEQANQLNQSSDLPLVATVSTVHLKPNAMNVIPGEVQLGIDIRSVDDSLKRELADRIMTYCKNREKESKFTIEVETLVDNASIFLDEDIQQKLQKACDQTGYRAIELDSGAGHDVMNMAVKWPSGLIFIPCKEGISHHPEEYASIEDLYKGSLVIAEYLRIETGVEHENRNRNHRTS